MPLPAGKDCTLSGLSVRGENAPSNELVERRRVSVFDLSSISDTIKLHAIQMRTENGLLCKTK